MSGYVGGSSRRNTRASLNAVSVGRTALNARSRYLPNLGGQVLVNSTSEPAGAAPATRGRVPPPPQRRPVTVAVLAEHCPPSVDRPRPPPRPAGALPSDAAATGGGSDRDDAATVVDVEARNNHRVGDSDVTTRSSPAPQQQHEQQHIV